MSGYKNDTFNVNFFWKCFGKWYWYAPAIILALLLAQYLLMKAPNIWSVTGSVIVDEEKSQSSQRPEETIIAGLPFNDRGSLNRQMQILKSRSLMEKVVDSLHLSILYFRENRFRDVELYKTSPFKVANVSDREMATGKNLRIKPLGEDHFTLVNENEDTSSHAYGVPFTEEGITYVLVRDSTNDIEEGAIYKVKFSAPREMAAWYSGQVQLRKLSQSNVLSITLKDQTPGKLQDIIYKLVEVYNEVAQNEKNKVAAKSLNFINDRLSGLNSELFSVEGIEANVRSSTEVTTDVGASAERYIQKLSVAEQTRTEINNTRNTLNNLQSFLQESRNQYELIPNYGDLGTISFAPLITQYNRLISGRQALLAHATLEHPQVKTASSELNKMRANILSGIGLAITDLNKKEGDIITQSTPVERKLQNLPFAEKGIKEITRQVDVKKEIVLYMLQKREETAIGVATQVESVRILDEPVQGSMPDSPSRTQFYAIALLLGLAFPTGLIFLLDFLNDKITTKTEVKALTSVPFLGEVAYAKSDHHKLIKENSRSVNSEMFRLIRTNLQFLTPSAKEKVIIVTSNLSGDGKTFVSGNLAACLALTGKKTVILELDLRKPKLSEFMLGKPSGIGITNYLVGEKTVVDIIQPVEEYTNLFILGSGPTPPNPAELIMSHKLDELFEYLKTHFDYIVVDTPPTGLVADAFLLNKFANTAIFVIRAGKTKKDDIKTIDDLCKEGRLNSPAIILNSTKAPKRYGYYY
ncbi:MAG: polysaccharide biosynthesis tyrosine autokinase [Saprospiraceae bacterium]|nr:MAG: polysaccharide biosynthesis tyrosine autokinase [Saprospiraceae bacterium]